MEKLFDEEYYAVLYPDYKSHASLPLLDYIGRGWKLGYNPSPFFNTRYYQLKNADHLTAEISPLEHFDRQGRKYGFKYFPEPGERGEAGQIAAEHLKDIAYFLAFQAGLYDPDYYRSTYPDVARAPSPLAHFRNNGQKEGRNPSRYFNMKQAVRAYLPDMADADMMTFLALGAEPAAEAAYALLDGSLQAEAEKNGVFNSAYYRAVNENVPEDKNSFLHYCLLGWRAMYNPSPFFNTRDYVERHQGARRINPLWHLLRHNLGELEAMATNPQIHPAQAGDAVYYFCLEDGLFDPEWYLDMNPDVKNTGVDPAVHFRRNGYMENRSPCEGVDCQAYARAYMGGDNSLPPLLHYFTAGKARGHALRLSRLEQSLIAECRELHRLLANRKTKA